MGIDARRSCDCSAESVKQKRWVATERRRSSVRMNGGIIRGEGRTAASRAQSVLIDLEEGGIEEPARVARIPGVILVTAR
jgi:hypothetical protein